MMTRFSATSIALLIGLVCLTITTFGQQVAAPSNTPTQTTKMAVDLFKAKNYDQAETVLRQVLENSADDATAHYYLGLTLLEKKKLPEAETELKKAQQLIQPLQDVQSRLIQLYLEQNQMDKADALLKQQYQQTVANDQFYYQRGLLQLKKDNFTGAAEDLEKASELNPQNAYAHYYAGAAYSKLKRPDRMISHFQAFLKMAPGAPEAPAIQALLKTVR